MLLGMALRASLVILPDPRDIPELLSAIQTWHVSYFPAAPTLYNAINNAPAVAAGLVDLTSIKACISGSAALLQPTKQKFEKSHRRAHPRRVRPVRSAHRHALQPAARGKPARLHRPAAAGRGCKNRQPGRWHDRNAARHSRRVDHPESAGDAGYHNMPEETALALRDGWLYTGDIARMDADGYFYIVDRKKELIKPGGMEVWPREVEEVLAAHPKSGRSRRGRRPGCLPRRDGQGLGGAQTRPSLAGIRAPGLVPGAPGPLQDPDPDRISQRIAQVQRGENFEEEIGGKKRIRKRTDS